MTSPVKMDRIIRLRLSGRFAHFRKFYTNASSLTYRIPPGTALRGMIASILGFPRDSYYEPLGSRTLQIAVAVEPGIRCKTVFQTLNYASAVGEISVHKQCRMELLMNSEKGDLAWILYLGLADSQNQDFVALEQKLTDRDYGFGIYLGQRQFIGCLDMLGVFGPDEFEAISQSEYLDSAISRESILGLESHAYDLRMERMPLEQNQVQEKKKQLRYTSRFGDIVFEQSGNRIMGSFANLTGLKDQNQTRISFL